MKYTFLLIFFLCWSQTICLAQQEKRYLFFLHNRFLEEHELADEHPEYGQVEYMEILEAFKKEGFVVISEKRKGNVNARTYAEQVVQQIDSLLQLGIPPGHITVVGTSKGGYIAQYASTLAQNPLLNFVFIGSFAASEIETLPQLQYCGNILSIYEKTDEHGVSARRRKETSPYPIPHFSEIELNTGLKHGFLFKALPDWITPTVQWAKQDYLLK